MGGLLMTCGMCATICWRCAERLQRLKSTLEAVEERGATLELAWCEASDAERPALAQQLADNIEECESLREEIDDLEGERRL